ncbi:glycoside hydrolase family 30 beta sandwich domain-containing protein [Sphingomonas sp. KR1UV-12]|uniref:Glycoside hydrolase family 30 beta sandwich domain-containing protein n=1 Tax=Sphingomonas aurea TaxID=3063994 RepID=A0ABT9EIH5_9SPHN|nr:glycoside hydrolase family 30 beta sandwich domain-containing protein [Sphingomonas sp. KR1UV-12]MDP1026704.1 glycoside hydrolase family 30 beta sandwich domain-containing protein [Sphingomonas sp. KR1UV-12]
MTRRALALVAALLAVGAAPAPREAVQGWQTNADGTQRLAPIRFAARPAAGAVRITVDPGHRYQTMVGFGASITDASAILIQALPPAERSALIRELFGRVGQGDGEGLGLDFTRLTIGASDFSPTHYSFDDVPPGQRDPDLSHFSIAPNRAAVLPTVKAALAVNEHLTVMASPWSPPAWMKTGDALIGGTLRPDAYGAYARYFVRYLRAYAAEGVPIRYLTIQNEPDFSPDSYPGMKWPATDRARFVGNDLGPSLDAAGLATRILEWDHNWDQPWQPETVLADLKAARYIAGVAWHCYGGNVTAQSRVKAAYPTKDAFFTECSGGGWRPGWKTGFGDAVRNLMIGATRNHARGVLLWNLALDPKGGPHKGGCDNCRGVVTIDPATGQVVRELEYYALGHLSRFVHPGAARIASPDRTDLPNTAFRNPDGSTVLLVYNATEKARPFQAVLGSATANHVLPPGAAVTILWKSRR